MIMLKLKLNEVLRQTNERFLGVLDHIMRTGNVTMDDADLLLSRYIDSLQDENEKEKFLKLKDPLHLSSGANLESCLYL